MISRQLETMNSLPAHHPYLETIHTSPTSTLAALEWAQYLGTTFGARGALEALRYYQDLGWISEPVRSTMVEHLAGLSLSELHASGGAVGVSDTVASLADSPFAPHLGSLWHIATVAGDDIDAQLEATRLQFGEFAPRVVPRARPQATSRNGDVPV